MISHRGLSSSGYADSGRSGLGLTCVRTPAGPRLAPPLCLLSKAIRRSERAAQAYGRPCAGLAAAAAAAEVAPPTAPARLHQPLSAAYAEERRRGGVARKDGRRLARPSCDGQAPPFLLLSRRHACEGIRVLCVPLRNHKASDLSKMSDSDWNENEL